MKACSISVLVALLMSGCADQSTTVLVNLTSSAAVTLTALSLSANIAGADGGSVTQSLGPSPHVPSNVVLELPDDVLTLDLSATGQSATGMLTATTTVQTQAHAQVSATLELTPVTQPQGGPSRCNQLTAAADGLIACAGFESTADSLNPGYGTGSATLDTSRAYRGASSVKLEIDGDKTTGKTFAEVQRTGLPTAPMYALRAFMYAPSPGPPSGGRILGFEQGSGTFQHLALFVAAGNHLELSHSTSGGSTTENITSMSTIPLDRWFCIEMRVTWGAPPTSQVRVLIDDAPIGDLDDSQTTTDTPPLNLSLTGQYFDRSPGIEYAVWADELVIASQPIGCTK